jgi:hypothetical protein
MNTGLGNAAVRSSKVTPPTPATVTAANNGTSLSLTTVQLGQAIGAVGNPAILLQDREVPMGGNSFQLGTNTDKRFFVDPAAGLYQLGDINAALHNLFLEINDTLFTCKLGDINSVGNHTLFTILEGAGKSTIFGSVVGLEANSPNLPLWGINSSTNTNAIRRGLSLNRDGSVAGGVGMGIDILTSISNAATILQNASQIVTYWGDPTNGAEKSILDINLIAGAGALETFLKLDVNAGLYEIGDIGNTNNHTFLKIDDAAQTATLSNGGNPWLLIDTVFPLIYIGDSNNAAYFGMQSNRFFVGDQVKNYFNIDTVTDNVGIDSANGLTITGDAAFLIHTGTALTDGAGAALGTLTNAPTAGDPAKWIAIDDNGTTRYIPTWT